MAQMQVDLAVTGQKCGKKAIEKARPYHAALLQARFDSFFPPCRPLYYGLHLPF
jgi:hypothetical protein